MCFLIGITSECVFHDDWDTIIIERIILLFIKDLNNARRVVYIMATSF